MDDARIRKLTSEVLAALGEREAPATRPASLEARLAALEAEVARLRQLLAGAGTALPATPATVMVSVHPSFQVLDVGTSSERCVLEPDKPCSQSGQCKALGH